MMRLVLLFAMLWLPACTRTAAPPAAPADAEAKMFSKNLEYEQFMGRWSARLSAPHAAFAQVKDGDRILDVGAGTGALALALEASLPNSQIVGIDPSAGFLELARQRAKSTRVRFEVGDAQALAFKTAEFDKTLAQLVMNFIPDHDKAIAEMRRVTRPGGVVSACVWDYDAGMEMLRFFWDEVVALDPGMAAKDERNLKLTRKGQLGDAWRTAGLINVEESPIVIDQAFASFDDYWGPFLKGAGPAGAYVVSLTDDNRKRLEARMRKRVLGGQADRAFGLKARAWCVRGEVPAP